MMTREKAWKKLNELMTNKNLIKHCLAVEAAMLGYAEYFKIPAEEKEIWSIAGLLHDADYEKYPQEHPQITVNWLKEQLSLTSESTDKKNYQDLINAVESHGFSFNVEAKSLMARVLRAVDELTGLVVAVALVRPNKKIKEVTVESILKKWQSPSFAAGVNRQEIKQGAQEIGVTLEQHLEIVLQSMIKISDQLGL